MKKTKLILLRFLGLALALLTVLYMGIPASALTLDTTSKTVSGEKSISYVSSTGFEKISGSNVSTSVNLSDGTTSNVTPSVNSDGSITYTLTAVSSYYYTTGFLFFTTHYYAQNGYATLTLTNTTTDTIKISYKDTDLSGLEASGDFYLTPSGTANAARTFRVVTTTTAEATSSVKTTGSITITGIAAVAELDINFYSTKYGSYTYTVGDASGSVAVATTATSATPAAAESDMVDTAITATATINPTYANSHQFYCWMSDGKVIGTDESLSCTVTGDMNIYPVFLPNTTITAGAPFTVNGTPYMFWHLAMEASASTGKPAILAIAEYTLPTTLEANGLRVANSQASGTDGALTYKIGSGAQLLIPYSTDDSGDFGEVPDNGASGYYNTQSAFRTLKVPANTTIECSGNINVNSQVYVDTAYSGAPGGLYGCINLMAASSKINLKSGSKLYCYGYIIGDGTVTAEDGSTVYESFQALGWRGGSVMMDWAGKAGVTGNTKTINSFAFSDYAIQNIEADLLVKYGATVNAVASLEAALSKQNATATYIVADNGAADQSGLVQLHSGASVRRSYDPVNDRITYKLYRAVDISKIKLELSAIDLGSILSGGLTLDTSNHIFALGRNMDFEVASGSLVTLLYDYKLMPSSKITIQGADASSTTPGRLVVSGNLYIYDTVDAIYDLTGTTYSYTYHQSGHKDVNAIPVPYIATTGVGSDFYNNIWYDVSSNTDPVLNASTPCAQVIVNGTMEVTGGLWTTSNGGKNADKVLMGTGTLINNNTNATTIDSNTLDEMFQVYNDSTYGTGVERVPVTVTPVVGLIAGLSEDEEDYKCFEAATYYGTESGYWYQYVISAEDEKNASAVSSVTNPNPASGSTEIRMTVDGATTTSTNAVGVVGNGSTITFTDNIASSLTPANGTFTFTANGYDVYVNDDKLSECTLINIRANTILVLKCQHSSWTDGVCDNCKVECTHTWVDGECTICNKICEHANWTDGVCDVCGQTCEHSFGNWTVSKEPTATESGEEKRSCTVCGAEETRKVEALGYLEIEFTQIVLGNALDMRFAFRADYMDDWAGAYAVATKEFADNRDKVVQTVHAEDWVSVTINGEPYYYFTFSDVSGKEMADNVYITIYNSKGEKISQQYTESIRSYIMRILENQEEKAKTMLVDMLNYGAAAQEFYGYGANDLANNALTDEQRAYATQTLTTCEDGRVSGDNYQGTRLELKNSINMHMLFAGLTTDMRVEIKFRNHRNYDIVENVNPVTFVEETGEESIIIDIDQIVVADGRQDVTVTVYNTNGTPEDTSDDIEYGSATDSIESYIARMLTRSEHTLYEMIMKFSDSAHAYLHRDDLETTQ